MAIFSLYTHRILISRTEYEQQKSYIRSPATSQISKHLIHKMSANGTDATNQI